MNLHVYLMTQGSFTRVLTVTMHPALYTRVSMDDQNLVRQKEDTWNYLVDEFDVPPSEISVYQTRELVGTSFAATTRNSCVAYAHRKRSGDRPQGLTPKPIHA